MLVLSARWLEIICLETLPVNYLEWARFSEAHWDGPGRREGRERFCRYKPINISNFDPYVRGDYFPYFPDFPAATAAQTGWTDRSLALVVVFRWISRV
jgi:hypothetical protein